MAADNKVSFYMQRIDRPGFNVLDIEREFDGLFYLNAKGLNTIGKSKNIYIEEYAESDRLRVSLPQRDSEYANEATTITMTFVIVGDAERRLQTLSLFTDYVRKGVHRYWDTARNREFDFIVTDEITVSDERWHGSTPYIEIQVPMQNLNGSTRDVSQVV